MQDNAYARVNACRILKAEGFVRLVRWMGHRSRPSRSLKTRERFCTSLLWLTQESHYLP